MSDGLGELFGKQLGHRWAHALFTSMLAFSLILIFFFGILSQMKFYKQESRTNGLITGRVCATSNTCETLLVAPALGPSAL